MILVKVATVFCTKNSQCKNKFLFNFEIIRKRYKKKKNSGITQLKEYNRIYTFNELRRISSFSKDGGTTTKCGEGVSTCLLGKSSKFLSVF